MLYLHDQVIMQDALCFIERLQQKKAPTKY